MQDALYEVYETDADDSMEPQQLKHSGSSFDLAENKMVSLYRAGGCHKDYLVYNTVKREIACAALSPSTMARRGICFE